MDSYLTSLMTLYILRRNRWSELHLISQKDGNWVYFAIYFIKFFHNLASLLGSFTFQYCDRIWKTLFFPHNRVWGHSTSDAKMNLVQTIKKNLMHKNVDCVNFSIHVRILVFKN